MADRTGLDLEGITITKPDRKPFTKKETNQFALKLVSLSNGFGWALRGALKNGQETLTLGLGLTAYKYSMNDFTDEEVEKFSRGLSDLAGQLDLLIQGEPKLVDINE